MDISSDPAITADPTHTIPQPSAADPVSSMDLNVADAPLPPERAGTAPTVAPAVAPTVTVSAAAPIPRHDPAPASGFNGARPGWWNGAEAAAATQGVNSDTLWKIAGIESAFGKNMGTRPGMGPFQIMPGTWAAIAHDNPSLGLTDRMDLGQHGKAAAALLRANAVVLRDALGRAPTDGEQYLVWFGGTGAGVKAAQVPADTPVTSRRCLASSGAASWGPRPMPPRCTFRASGGATVRSS